MNLIDIDLSKLQQILDVDFASTLSKLSEQVVPNELIIVNSILISNFNRGRITTFTENDPSKIQKYINRVVDNFHRNNLYLNRLQIDRNDDDWSSLFEKLNKWAYRFFISKGFSSIQVNSEEGFGLASEASLAILYANFPYDTEFDPWAYVILENCCLKYMRSNLKSSIIPSNKLLDIDDNRTEFVGDLDEELNQIDKEMRKELFESIETLAPMRKTVILHRYFHDLSPEEIAKKINKSTAAIYSLQFNALQDLRKILQEKGID